MLLAGRGVEVAGRLVGEQHVRVASRTRARSRRAAARRPTAAADSARRARRGPRDRALRARLRARRSGRASSSGSITFSSAVSDGTRWNDWNTKPTCCARTAARPSSSSCVRSLPGQQRTARGRLVEPASSASSVDLPAPDAPMIATDLAARGSQRHVRQNGERSLGAANLLAESLRRQHHRRVVHQAVLRSLPFCPVPRPARLRRGRAARAADAPAAAPTILVLGDSLSAAYGIRVEQGWVALLQTRLRAKGYGYRVVNASSSGETTGGALARLPRALATHRPAIVIVELGGNDGLRGLPVADIRREPRRHHPHFAAGRGEGPAGRHEDSAQLRPGLHPRLPRPVWRPGARSTSCRCVPFLLDGRRAGRSAVAGRRHPSRRRPRSRGCWTRSGRTCEPLLRRK